MYTAFVVPNENAMVRDPITKVVLPMKGKAVTLLGGEGRYWRRRIKSGSVRVINSPDTTYKIKNQRKSNKEE